MADVAGQLAPVLTDLLGSELPLRLRTWDGAEAGPVGAPVLVLRNRRALRHLIWRPDELGLARAYVSGDLDLDPDSDLYELLGVLARLMDQPQAVTLKPNPRDLFGPQGRRLLRTAVGVGAIGPRPPLPPEEARLKGNRHSLGRDRNAISHHYDVGNDFYRLVLGPSMVYSCAYWTPDSATLEQAQAAKLDLICRKLGLREGMRLLDVGCGWGSMLLHAAQHYGVHGVGITLSEEQAHSARQRIEEAGLSDRLTVRLQDYREVPDGPYDAISSIGMAEHVGTEQYRSYAAVLHQLLAPGGRLLNHQIARRPSAPGDGPYRTSPFIAAYVFPDGDLSPVGETVSLLEEAGFEIRDVESLREHYALTLRAWVANLESEWDRATKLTTLGRARVWRLYMAASALAFEENRIGVNQVLAVRTKAGGRSGVPRTRAEWLGVSAPVSSPETGAPSGAPSA